MTKRVLMVTAGLLLLPTLATAAQFPLAAGAAAPKDGLAARGVGFDPTWKVDCDNGGSIIDTLSQIPPGDGAKVLVLGTCEESVIIERDGITLGGYPEATLIGGIRVAGATRVTIHNLTVTNNTVFEGAVEAIEGAAVLIRDVSVVDSTNRGIRIRDSVAEIRDVSVTNSLTVGLLGRGARLTLEGDISITDSNETNIILTAGSSAFSKEGHIFTSGGDAGIIVQTSSVFEGVFGSLTAVNNTIVGMLVAAQGDFVYSFNLDLSDNGFFGLWVDESSSFSPFSNIAELSETTITGNGFIGAAVQRSSTLEFSVNTTISDNPFGIFVDDSVLRSTSAIVTGNGSADVFLTFGARGTFETNTIGSVVCDPTILIRGDALCL